jgi:hypothetical protein
MGGVMGDYLLYVTLGLVILCAILNFLAYRRAKSKVNLILTGLYVVIAGWLVADLLLRRRH